MPRKKRQSFASQIYHVVVRGIRDVPLFDNVSCYQKFLNLLADYNPRFHNETYAYCLLNDGIHLAIKSDNLSGFMQLILSSYAYWYNLSHGRTGHLYSERFQSRGIEAFELPDLIVSIHNLPVEKHIKKNAASYEYSSLQDYIKNDSELINISFVTDLCGGKSQLMHLLKSNPATNYQEPVTCRRTLSLEECRKIYSAVCRDASFDEFRLFTDKMRSEYFKSLYNKGLSIRQIAQFSGWSKGTVERVLKN